MSWWRKFVGKVRGASHPLVPKYGDGCDHHPEAIHLRQGTAEFEEFVARGELETGHNLAHGASHLANLLSYDPARSEWRALLDGYLSAGAPDPEALIPRVEKPFYGTEALRAYLWQKQGRLSDAVELLVSVVGAKKEACYLEAWALDWLEAPGAIESISDLLGTRLFASTLGRFPEARRSPLPRLRQIRRWAMLVERFAAAHPLTNQMVMIRVGLLRKAGFFDEGAAVARGMLEQSPDWHVATALGLILREKGDCPGADAAFRHALELDPSDVTARLEAGDMYFDRQEWTLALNWYENALAREAGQPWALASRLYCRWQSSGDDAHLNLLIELAKAENPRARMLCQRTFWGDLPEPSDASANLLRQLRDEIRNDPNKGEVSRLKVTMTCLEAPSNYLAFRLEYEASGTTADLALTVARVPQPDPREPIETGTYQLWTYDGVDASPGLPPPPPDVSEPIARLAATPYDEPVNWADASRVAEQLGPARVGEVLATMVHPPPLPEGLAALAWLPRVQLVAAQVAAQIDAGWEGSARREALFSVLLGPRDWATEAAIRVLARIGREDESLAYDIHQAFQRLDARRTVDAPCSWERTLYGCWLDLPLLFPAEREELQRKLREIEEQDRAPEN